MSEPDDDRYDEDEETGGRIGGFLVGLLLGALLGAGTALLIAPESGRDTRRRLGRLAREARSDVEERVSGLRSGAERRLARRRRQLRRAARRAAEGFESVKDKLTP